MKVKRILNYFVVVMTTLFCLTAFTGCNNNNNNNNVPPVDEVDEIVTIEGLPSGTSVVYQDVTDSQKANIDTYLEGVDYDKSKEVYVYDISLESNGEKVQPGTYVTVKVAAPYRDAPRYTVVHILHNNEIEILDSDLSDGIITFRVNSFSYFVFAPMLSETHEHDFGDWKYDDANHWKQCSCGEMIDEGGHEYNNDGECIVCGYKYVHEHKYSESWSYNDNDHYHICSCGDRKDVAAHTFENFTCTVCGYQREHTHTYEWVGTSDGHYQVPTCGCDIPATEMGHHEFEEETIRETTCLESGEVRRTCKICGYSETYYPYKEHTVDAEHYYYDENHEYSYDDYHYQLTNCDNHEPYKVNFQPCLFGEWTLEKESTEYEHGVEVRVCEYCGHRQTRDLDLLPHTHVFGDDCLCACGLERHASNSNGYCVHGDDIYFGKYPQTRVDPENDKVLYNTLKDYILKDYRFSEYFYEAHKDEFKQISGNFKKDYANRAHSYGYYDFILNGQEYRFVVYLNDEVQPDGYACVGRSDNDFYFYKVEPIKWVKFTTTEGVQTLLPAKQLDFVAYRDETNAHGTLNEDGSMNIGCQWATSSLRKFLNDEFYNYAFSDAQKTLINPLTVLNGGETTRYSLSLNWNWESSDYIHTVIGDGGGYPIGKHKSDYLNFVNHVNANYIHADNIDFSATTNYVNVPALRDFYYQYDYRLSDDTLMEQIRYKEYAGEKQFMMGATDYAMLMGSIRVSEYKWNYSFNDDNSFYVRNEFAYIEFLEGFNIDNSFGAGKDRYCGEYAPLAYGTTSFYPIESMTQFANAICPMLNVSFLEALAN